MLDSKNKSDIDKQNNKGSTSPSISLCKSSSISKIKLIFNLYSEFRSSFQ